MSKKINKNRYRIGIVGMGPVGITLAVHFIEAGALVIPCDIDKKKIDRIKKDGLRLKLTMNKSVPVENVSYTIQGLEKYSLDLVIIAVKTVVLDKVIQLLSKIISEKMFVLFAQNGLDNEQKAIKTFGENKILRMVINYAGNMENPNTVLVSFFNPPNYIATLMPKGDDVAIKIAKLLNSVGLKTEVPEDIQDYVWEKVILNSALSAICAITGKTMQKIMRFPKTLELVEAIIDESVTVADREGIDLGKKFRRSSLRYLKHAGDHRPSMLIDLENGRRTEIDALNGKIVEYGRKHYIPTPINLAVTALIHIMEDSEEKN